jgi:hypothetical protein
MAWPYHPIDIGDEQKLQRRELLDRYGLYAQLSALIPILGYQLYRLGAWVYTERLKSTISYSEVPSSVSLRRQTHKTSGVIVQTWRLVIWWLEDEVAPGWGLIGHWIAAGCWTSWLLFFCIHQTGDGKCWITLFWANSCVFYTSLSLGEGSTRDFVVSFRFHTCLSTIRDFLLDEPLDKYFFVKSLNPEQT